MDRAESIKRPRNGYARRDADRFETRRSARRSREKADSGVKAARLVILVIVLCIVGLAPVLWEAGNSYFRNAATPVGGVPISRTGSALETGYGTAPLQTGDYQQLSDPLLVLVNDNVPLPDDWQVTPAFIGNETVDNRIYDQLTAMFDAAGKDDVWLWVASGYRSVEEQEGVLNREIRQHIDNDGMTEDEAREYSLRTIARPGYSEHHTGLVVDLNDVSDNFESTEAYRWLSEHAADYGFVQRYRHDKVNITGIENESWHYRFVGVEHAQEMQRLDMCLEEYVQYLKDQGIL